ncbi:hypothetical protein HETIRDRAFT_435892 [Heterobasidion irregulare TC 32-1]|uniref:RING-type domain-containing protein n=1 Tax=Heterobasidion irregulare (strain TC 32-1) TaxID=747525 RepID=W4JY08_HETIT|nr:uncharacterized protein HETIRDRAFT_435892 [Heterobasidion irregulare TC 32-1]ETW77980.1 hypothetical protein HETIRDRAFT_435892 [Heterobasidion irregulare TC 32-1]
MPELFGMPLLSGPPPPSTSSRADICCRKCNKEFNILFTRARRCNHCGYSYCSSCSDYQALMPRSGSESGYQPMPVCSFCIENLNITAGGKSYLKGLSLARLKKYVDAYNIKVEGILEKDELISRIIASRRDNGCLPPANEDFYRKYSVPVRQGSRSRGLFSRTLGQDRPFEATPPSRPPPQNPSSTFARPDLDPSQRHNVPPPPPRPTARAQAQQAYNQPRTAPYSTRQPPPPHSPRPQYPQHNSATPPHYRPNTAHPGAQSASNMPGRWGTPPSRPASAAPAVPPQPRAPVPTLEQLMNMTEDAIAQMSIGTLKSVLFQNHVNARLLLEKSDLVAKVRALVTDERREREREAALRAREEQEIIERQHAMMEEHRMREEQLRLEREAREREESERARAGDSGAEERDIPVQDDGEAGVPLEKPGDSPRGGDAKTSSPVGPSISSSLERSGLCIICQDEEANIAIVDCGHLAMCRGCSELVMSSSRECPLCRTRIVTEGRLLRIFKT